jgi:microcystin-dependent protein
MAPYVGEIRLFAGNFAPEGWAFCDGQLLPISENETLFNLIGTTYGGDGQETFALPNLQSRIPLHQGQGPGISVNYMLAEMAGVEQVTLNVNQIPSHSHPVLASTDPAQEASPQGNVLGRNGSFDFFRLGAPTADMAPGSIGSTGSSQPHENMMPFLCVNFIISLFGVFPTQT